MAILKRGDVIVAVGIYDNYNGITKGKSYTVIETYNMWGVLGANYVIDDVGDVHHLGNFDWVPYNEYYLDSVGRFTKALREDLETLRDVVKVLSFEYDKLEELETFNMEDFNYLAGAHYAPLEIADMVSAGEYFNICDDYWKYCKHGNSEYSRTIITISDLDLFELLNAHVDEIVSEVIDILDKNIGCDSVLEEVLRELFDKNIVNDLMKYANER